MTDASTTRNATRSASSPPEKVDRLVRWAAILALTGFLCVFLFLVFGFQAWSVGVGIFLGCPLLLGAIVCYAIAVIRDLRVQEAL